MVLVNKCANEGGNGPLGWLFRAITFFVALLNTEYVCQFVSLLHSSNIIQIDASGCGGLLGSPVS